jgi:large subunit ribosomal protein L4e
MKTKSLSISFSDDTSVSVDSGSSIVLPDVFESVVREDLVRRAVHSARANRRQAYGHREHQGRRKPVAGMKHSVEWWGKGRGVSRIMRRSGSREGAENPHTRGGRRAHGPKVAKNWSQKMNTKERRAARDSALAATSQVEVVRSRGHRFDSEVSFPIVIEGSEGSIEEFDLNHGTQRFIAMMNAIGLGEDLVRARDGRSVRAGRGKMRGRRRKTPKSVLLVVSDNSSIGKAARNVPGVDVVVAKNLSAEHLAPGGDIGRLTVFTKEAVEEMR